MDLNHGPLPYQGVDPAVLVALLGLWPAALGGLALAIPRFTLFVPRAVGPRLGPGTPTLTLGFACYRLDLHSPVRSGTGRARSERIVQGCCALIALVPGPLLSSLTGDLRALTKGR